MTGEAYIKSGVGSGVCRLSRFEEAIQEVDRHNRLLCLRNRLFPKSVQALLGVVRMLEPVSIYMYTFDSREG